MTHAATWVTRLSKLYLAITASLAAVLMASVPTYAQISVFVDNFDGTSLSSEWTQNGSPEKDINSFVTVADGNVSFIETSTDYNYTWMWGTPTQLAGLGTSNDWTAEIRFKYYGFLQTPDADRNVSLLTGVINPTAFLNVAGIDFRIQSGSQGDSGPVFNLSWWGNDSTTSNKVPELIQADLNKDQFYTIKAHAKPGGMVDLFLDGNPMLDSQSAPISKPIIGSVHPEGFRVGEGASRVTMYGGADLAGGLVVDYIKVEKAVPPALPGDFNGNNVVDAADYVLWRKNLNTSNALPNDNNLGTPISTAHYNLWRANFGSTPGSGSGLSAGNVPEPTTAGLVALAFASVIISRRPLRIALRR